MLMDRKWHRVSTWECVVDGMYAPGAATEEGTRAAMMLLGDPVLCDSAMRHVVDAWPISCEQHLMDTGINRRAWLGRACVCITTGFSQASTRIAWFMLSREQQSAANAVADEVIADYERGKSCQRSLLD